MTDRRPVRRLSSSIGFLGVLLSLTTTAHGQSGQYVPGELLVKFREGVSQIQAANVVTAMGATAIQNYTNLGIIHMRVDPQTDLNQLIVAIEADPNYEFAEPNYIVHADATTPNDPFYPNNQWGLNNTGQLIGGSTTGTADADIDAPEAWDITTGSSTIVVGIVDTGIDYNHPDLAANIWTNPGEVAGNGIDDDGNGFIDDTRGWDFVNNDNDPMDDNYHGTHVAGTVGAVGNNGVGVTGVSWTVKLVPLKILDASGSGTIASGVAAINYAVTKGIKLTNHSWGSSSFSQTLQSAIEQANTNGMLVIAAAGNDGTNNDVIPHYPANHDVANVVSVTSTDINDAISSFSNFGLTTVDLGAPGSLIASTTPVTATAEMTSAGIPTSYAFLYGTSMATPHVTGVAALVWAKRPTLTHSQVRALLLNSADAISSLNGKAVTGGRLNAAKALQTNQLVFSTQPAGSVSGTAFTTQPVVTARDIAGNTDETFNEIVTLSLASGAGALSGTLSVQAVNGVAVFTNMSYTATADGESFTLSANDQDGVGTNLSVVTSNSISADVVASQLVFTTQPAPLSALSGTVLDFTTDPVVEARGANNVRDPGFTGTVTLTETGAGTATYTNNSVSAVAGVATFTGLTVTYTATADGEGFALLASSGGLTANSSSITSNVVPPDYDGSGVVDFDDFFLFADNFGLNAVSPSFSPVFDLDGDGRVGYGDLFIFADNFARGAADIAIPDPPGPGPGPFANAGASFTLGDNTVGISYSGIGPDQQIEFEIEGFDLVGVRQFEIALEVSPIEAIDLNTSTFASQEFITLPLVREGTQLRVGGVRLGTGPVDGQVLLGTFELHTAPSFAQGTEVTIQVARIAVGPSSTAQDVFDDLNLKVELNPPSVSHRRGSVLTGEPLDIFAQVPTSSLTLVQAEIHAGANDPPVATVELRDDGVAPDAQAGDQVYSGRWAGSEQVGQYSIDLITEDEEGDQEHRAGMDYFSIVHTIFSIPELMLVSPEGLANIRIPLLLEDHGSGYLSQGFLAAQFGIQMQGSGLTPGQPTMSFVGTGLEEQSFSLNTSVTEIAGGWQLEGALTSETPLHLSPSPGPGQQVLAYVEVGLVPDDPGGSLDLSLTQALFEADPTGVGIQCCGSLGLGRGDVDLNAHIESFDASLALMHRVFKLNLDNPEDPDNDAIESQYGFTLPANAAQMADVSGQLGVTALDAALILQREVGLISHFPAEEDYYRLWEPPVWWNPPTAPGAKPLAVSGTRPLERGVFLGAVKEEAEGMVVVPVEIDQMEGVLAGTLALSYEAQALQPVGVRATPLTQGYLLSDHVQGGQVWVSFAGPRWRAGSGAVMEVLFRRQGEGIGALGLRQVQLNEEEVQVEEVRLQTVSPVPRELALYPNYPNPFNPRTVIGYGLPAGGEVELSVYNLAGQRVRRLWVGWQGVGVHQLAWDGRDEEGRVLSSGVYVCRLAAGQRVLVRKMLLVK